MSTFGESTGPHSGDAFGESTGDAFGESTGHAFGESTGDAFGESTGDAFGESTGDAFGEPAVTGQGQAPSGVLEIANDVVRRGEEAGVHLRLIGGAAIVLHAQHDSGATLRRTPEDIDLVAHKSARTKLDGVFDRAGFSPDRHFNALNGSDRRIYYSESGVKADVFVGSFRMCHVIPIEEKRLVLDHPTAPLAELVMTKAQVVQLTNKDVTDLVALLSQHELGDHDDGVINASWMADLCAHDWGLWRTVSGTLQRLGTLVHDVELDHQVKTRVAARLEDLLAALERAPKSQKWKMRNRIGDRMVWYELPEDPTAAPEPASGTSESS